MNAIKLAVYNLRKTWKSTIFYAFSLFLTSAVSYFFVAATMLDRIHGIQIAEQIGLSNSYVDFFLSSYHKSCGFLFCFPSIFFKFILFKKQCTRISSTDNFRGRNKNKNILFINTKYVLIFYYNSLWNDCWKYTTLCNRTINGILF